MSLKNGFLFISGLLILAGCASSSMKQRKEQRDKLVQAGGKMYCEFINGDVYSDIDVALNIEMAKRCDVDKPFSISQYKTPSENQGIMYCCSTSKEPPTGVMQKRMSARPTRKIRREDKKENMMDKANADKADKDEKAADKNTPAAEVKEDSPAAPAAESKPPEEDEDHIEE
ncbi:MAG: hypothetical protein COT73_07950 [Bdellovibrio sp. CG10_big_fil_rev_8_21_14_0_10_47_8]|nr:MAG: hypothetical protein COT73_07950 [Bdellovibrio sp. CG10_big_fil_rev_8_21_14_0_10_47_8]